MSTRILCRCCGKTAEVKGRFERRQIPDCRNGTFVDGGTKNSPSIGGKNLRLIQLFDVKENKFVPLVD